MKLDAKFYVQTAHLSPHDLGVLVRLIIAGPGGDAIPDHLVPMLDQSKHISLIRSEAGKKGGRPKKQIKQIESKPKAKPKETTPIEWPNWAGPKVMAMWEEFKTYKRDQHRFQYKSPASEQAALNLLAKYYASGKLCVEGLDTAMAKGWMFPVDPAEQPVRMNGASTPAAPIKLGWNTPTGE